MKEFEELQKYRDTVNDLEDELKALRDGVELAVKPSINAAILQAQMLRDSLWEVERALEKGGKDEWAAEVEQTPKKDLKAEVDGLLRELVRNWECSCESEGAQQGSCLYCRIRAASLRLTAEKGKALKA